MKYYMKRSIPNFGTLISIRVLMLIVSFSYCTWALGQNVNMFNGMTEAMLLKHFKEAGIKYSIEGIWVEELELTSKMYHEGVLIYNDTRKSSNKTKTAYVLVGSKIHILKYDPIKLIYTVVNDNFIMPTPNKFVYNFTMPSSYDADIGIQFEEFNTEMIVKDYFISYTTSPQPANEKPGEEIMLIGKHTGYKLAPID